jgi:hypothetical protein
MNKKKSVVCTIIMIAFTVCVYAIMSMISIKGLSLTMWLSPLAWLVCIGVSGTSFFNWLYKEN